MTDDHIDAYCIAMDLCALAQLISRTWSANDPVRNALRNTTFTIPFALLESGKSTICPNMNENHRGAHETVIDLIADTGTLFSALWQRSQITGPHYRQGKRLLVTLTALLLKHKTRDDTKTT